jgi:hypothetical protein
VKLGCMTAPSKVPLSLFCSSAALMGGELLRLAGRRLLQAADVSGDQEHTHLVVNCFGG